MADGSARARLETAHARASAAFSPFPGQNQPSCSITTQAALLFHCGLLTPRASRPTRWPVATWGLKGVSDLDIVNCRAFPCKQPPLRRRTLFTTDHMLSTDDEESVIVEVENGAGASSFHKLMNLVVRSFEFCVCTLIVDIYPCLTNW